MIALRSTAVSLATCLFALTAAAFAQTANGSLSGHVVDQNSAAVVAATVYIAAGPADTGMARAVQTDADGHFKMVDLPPGSYTLSALKPQDGYGDPASPLFGNRSVLVPVAVASATETPDVEISLARPGGTLHIEAYDAVSHKPLLKALYVLRQVNNSGAVMQGEKTLPADFLLPPVDVTVELHADGYAAWTMQDETRNFVTLQPGEHRNVRADLKPLEVAPATAAAPATK